MRAGDEQVEIDRGDTPGWYRAADLADTAHLLSAAVRHVCTISPAFNWVGIYILRGDTLELGPYVGAPTEHTRIKVGVGVCGTAVARDEDINVPDVTAVDNYLACSTETASELVVLIRAGDGSILGQIDIDSHTRAAFAPAEEAAVKQVARELGEVWRP